MQNVLYCLDVSVILMYRISELVFVAIDVLRPVITVFSSIYPALVCLSFDDKDTINRYDNMINLSSISVVLDEKVIDDFISVFGEFL